MMLVVFSSLCFTPRPLWAQEVNESSEVTIEVSTEFNYVAVDGDKEKFRQDYGVDKGITGGIKSFKIHYNLAPGTSFEMEGCAILPENDSKGFINPDEDAGNKP
jgi:hypothetical protein